MDFRYLELTAQKTYTIPLESLKKKKKNLKKKPIFSRLLEVSGLFQQKWTCELDSTC